MLIRLLFSAVSCVQYTQSTSEAASSQILGGGGHMSKKSLIRLEGNSMTPRHAFLFCSSHQQPCLCLGPLEDLFEVKLRPSRALSLPSFWNYRETMTQSGMLQ